MPQFLTAKGKSLGEAGSDDIRAYLARLHGEGLKAASAARKLSAIRQFHKFLYGEAVAKDNPAAIVDAPRQSRRLPKTLSLDDVDALIATAEKRIARLEGKARLRAQRLHCLIELLYATGLRVSELVGLTRRAMAAASQVLTVKGKGGRERIVPIGPKARAAISTYLAACDAEEGEPSPWLFASHGEGGHLTRQHFALELKALAREAGLDADDDLAACAAPCFRQPSACRRRRPARGAADARPRRHFDHADLYPYRKRPADPGRSRPSSAGEVRLTSRAAIATLRRVQPDQVQHPRQNARLSRFRRAARRA